MNAVVRIIVLGFGALALLSGSGCAVGTGSGHEDEGTSASALSGGEQQVVVGEDESRTSSTSDNVIHLPPRLTRPTVSTPGSENSKPADPSPWLDPHGTK